MADTMQFDLVSPERRLASAQVASVQIPGADGDMTAMPDHAPTITTLRPGILTVDGPDGQSEYVVTGGFAEITRIWSRWAITWGLPPKNNSLVVDDQRASLLQRGLLRFPKPLFCHKLPLLDQYLFEQRDQNEEIA